MDVYNRIMNLCDTRNVTVKAVETACGLSNGSIGKLRNGGKMSADRMLAIAEYFNVTVEYLLTGKQPEYYTHKETARIAQRIFDEPSQRILFDASEDLAPEDALFLAEMAKKMKRTNPDG